MRVATRGQEGLEVRFVLAGEVVDCSDVVILWSFAPPGRHESPPKNVIKLQCCPMSIGYFCR